MTEEHAQIASVRRRLDKVNRRLGDHPLNSVEFTRARSVLKEMSETDPTVANAALRGQGLPTVGAQMRMMVRGLTSLARLNRRRLRLEETLLQLEADGRG